MAGLILLHEPPTIVNVAAYRFAELQNLPNLQKELRAVCEEAELKGTILLSREGINLFVAGLRPGIDALLARLRRIPQLADLAVKESLSPDQPFNRLLVKIKREIIAFGVAGIDPRRYTSRRVSAGELKRWLDEGRSVTLLDARNNFEVQAGTFNNAVAIGIDDFRDFPVAAGKLPDEWKSRPLVTFCTGGIRCEKAAPYLESAGFQEVYQLDGGILKYLEECGGAHYQGDCFVFDKRVAVDAALRPSGLRQCFVCQAILSAADQASPRYVEGQSCPRCHKPEVAAQEALIQKRHAALRQAATPLPGSVPYDNARPISVPLRLDGVELLEFLDAMHTHLSRDEWKLVCSQGRLVCQGEPALPGRMVRSGERYWHLTPATVEPDVNAKIEILHEDEALVVINKPAPLPMHPCGRFNRNTLSYLLGLAYHPVCLRPAHRLDADTSGAVVFTKSRQFARLLQPQFEAGAVAKTYLALVRGRPPGSDFECHAPLNGAPGPQGMRIADDADGKPAGTRFQVLREFDNGTALLSVQPLTGRTNQIRAHLWLLDLPVVGDPMYLPGHQLGAAQSLSIVDPPLCLHASEIQFRHPLTQLNCRIDAPAPKWTRNAPGASLTEIP